MNSNWAVQCENMSSGICGQRRHRSVCAYTHQDIYCAQSIGHYKMFQLRANTRMKLCTCAGWCESAHFAQFSHARRHLFAWRGPNLRIDDIIEESVHLQYFSGSYRREYNMYSGLVFNLADAAYKIKSKPNKTQRNKLPRLTYASSINYD